MTNDLALMLSGGGARAAYQVGALRAVAELAPQTRFSVVTGVSAGAINTISLAATPGTLAHGVDALEAHWRRLRSEHVYCVQPTGLLRGALRSLRDTLTGRLTGDPAVRGLLSMDPLRAFLRGAVNLDGIAEGIATGRLRAAALSATSYTTGWTTTFVECHGDVPTWTRVQRMAQRTRITVDHVVASAAIPIVFPAVRINREYYGDGSLRQAAPLAPAIHLGARRIVAIGMRAPQPATVPVAGDTDYPSSAEVFGLLLNSVFLDHLDVDAERLERVNQVLASLPPGADPPGDMRLVRLLVLRPTRDLGEMAQGQRLRLPRGVSWLVRAMGGARQRASDFLSYLMFEPPYTSDLMDLGYHDTHARREAIEAFMEGDGS